MTRVGQNWGDWQRWTPTLTATTTNPTLGTDATQDGAEISEGTLIRWKARIVLGTGATAGTGYYQLPLPYEPDLAHAVVGAGTIAEGEAPNMPWPVMVALAPALAVSLSAEPAHPFLFLGDRSRAINAIGAAIPGEWEAGDIIDVCGFYEAATS